MKKVCAVSAMLLFVLPFCFAQNFLPKGTYRSPFENGMSALSKGGGIRGQRFLTPIIGYENYVVPGESNANAALLGLDFMYRRNSGFTVWFNNALILGNASYITRGYEYFFYPPFHRYYSYESGGFVSGWAGEFLLGYSKTARNHQFDFGAGLQTAFGFGDAVLAEFAALAFRFDYACFFNGKVGITACITDGLGYGMVGNSPGFMNAFSIKLGPIFKL